MAKLTPIKCEIQFAPTDRRVFHIITYKDGKKKLVCYGRVFPLKGTKNFVRAFERDFGTIVTNRIEFFRAVKAFIKERKQQK